jgi:4-diphosphocytidyl-2-C-methyl-D-erythritol kinase
MTVKQIELTAPAKINLCLRVLGKRPDGYHEILSIMQAVDLCDEISFALVEGDDISIECNDPEIPTGADNLISRAFHAMKDRYSFAGGLKVKLLKRIPSGSGLGGGSSDCAAAIRAANKIFGTRLSRRDMSQLGAELGSDVPFFLSSGSAIVRGRGEIVEDVELPLDYGVLIVVPNVAISTDEVYSRLRLGLTKGNTPDTLKVSRGKYGLADLTALIGNDLEQVVCECCPEVGTIKEGLSARGLEHVSMSGSGSAVFAVVPVRWVEERIGIIGKKWGGWKVFAARPIRLIGI